MQEPSRSEVRAFEEAARMCSKTTRAAHAPTHTSPNIHGRKRRAPRTRFPYGDGTHEAGIRLLPGSPFARCAVRWAVLCRGEDDRDLLPAGLPGADAAGEIVRLRGDGGGGGAGGV